jgi:SHS family lactate transporter-like MFS transporter
MQITSDGAVESLRTEEDIQGWQYAVLAGILGWVLDAFDFFVVVFLLSELMNRFHVGKGAMVWSLTITLAMRPLGAVIFGGLADRFGRRKPLIACVVYFSGITMLSGFAPNYLFFFGMRALYGIGMGGYWGIGASYAMESAPRRYRGILSGAMQGGYPFGYLLAAIGMQTIAPRFGWQAMFVVGSLVAAIIVLITIKAPESEAWKLHRMPSVVSMFKTLLNHRGSFAYILLLMTMMTCLSHGTQDLYPDFLKTIPKVASGFVFGMKAGFGIPVIYNIGAIVGAVCFGGLSEKIGRRYSIIGALLLCILAIPAWAFGQTLIILVVGSCMMQTGVQGAFGVIPAHLSELSPDAIRGLFPGFVYQLGVLVASPVLPVQNLLRQHFGYPSALASFESGVILCLLFIFGFGPEKHGRSFRLKHTAVVPAEDGLGSHRSVRRVGQLVER